MYEHLDVLSASAIPLLTRPQRDADLARLPPAASAQETQTRKVVALLASAESNAELRAWAEASGFNLSSDYDGNPRDPAAFDFHVTLLATVDPCGIPEAEYAIEPIVVYADGFKVLGADRRVPCLSIDVEADDFGRVASMRRHYIDTYGAEPTFAEFVPHVSLSYAWDGAPALEDLAVPSMPIVLDRIRVTSLDQLGKATAAPCSKSFLADFDQSIVDALLQAEGGADVWAEYQAVAAQIDDVDAEIGRISSAMENVRRLAEQLLAIRALGGTPPAPQDRAEAFARFDALQEELDVWTSEKRGLLEQASRLEGEMLRLIS